MAGVMNEKEPLTFNLENTQFSLQGRWVKM